MPGLYLLFLVLLSINQSTADQSINQSTNHLKNVPINQSTNQSTNQSINTAACVNPFVLFNQSINLFGSRRFPLSDQPVKIPIGSWVDRCPINQTNFQSTNQSTNQSTDEPIGNDRYSCCNDQSIEFVDRLIDDYTNERDKLIGLMHQLTTDRLWGVLTNQSTDPEGINQSMSQLSIDQLAALSTIQQSFNQSINQGIQCSDHWMGYVSGLFCLGCDPLSSFQYINQPINQSFQSTHQSINQFLHTLYLDPSTCHSIFDHCGPFLQSVFFLFQSFPKQILTVGSVDLYPQWLRLSTQISTTFQTVKQAINVDMCFPGDCEQWFCEGSFMETGDIDRLIDQSMDASYISGQSINQPISRSINQSINRAATTKHQHGFRGLNYQWDTSSFDRLIDVQAVLSFVICLMRWGYGRDDTYDPSINHIDGCPRHSNLLYLLGEAAIPHSTNQSIHPSTNQSIQQSISPTNQSIYPLFIPPTSQCVPHDFVACSFGDNDNSIDQSTNQWSCFPRYAHCASWATGVNDYDCPQEPDCSIDGLMSVEFKDYGGFKAYEVGCNLSINQSICYVPPAPDNTPPGVTHKYVLIFAVTISVGVSLLIIVVVYCYWQHRRALSEQRWSALRHWRQRRSTKQSINAARHRPSISENQSPLDDRPMYRPLMND